MHNCSLIVIFWTVVVLNSTGIIIGRIHIKRHHRDAEDAEDAGSLGSRSRGVRRDRDTILIVIL